MAGSSTADPAFYFDLASPASYLVAESILHTLPGPCAWVPVRGSALPGGVGFGGFRCAEEERIARDEIERRAVTMDLQPLRWPAEVPFDSEIAQLAATYARQVGRVVAFTQAAFRQAYAGGWDLAQPDHVLIAASGCEMHPTAVLKSFELRNVRAELSLRTEEAIERGVRSVPAIWAEGEVFEGDALLARAAEAMAA